MGTPILFGTNNDQNIIVQVEYDKAGRQTAQRDPRGKRTTYAYDQLNRRVSLTDPLNHTWLTAYPRLTGGGSRLTRTDPLGVVTQQDSDRLGRLAILSYLNESPKLTPDITFGYDKKGSRTRMTEANGASTVRDTRYTYNRAQRLKQVDFDTNGDGLIDQSVAYGYDAGGLRTSLTLPGSKTVTYQYNTLQQLIRLTDWNGQATNNLYDSLGRLIALTRSNGATSQYQYDSVGHLRLLRHTANGKTLAHHAYTVDARGNRTQAFEVLSKASTGSTTLAYNDPAVSYYIGIWTAAAPYQTTANISAALQIACLGTTLTLTMGQGPDHSIYDLYVDNTLWQSIDGYATTVGDRVLSIPVTADGPHFIDVRNRPEKNAASTGYVLRFKSLVVSGQQYDAQTIQYQYDALSRLNQARYGTGANTLGTPFKEYDYTYDVAGNRTQQVTSLNGIPTPTNYTYDDANRLVSDGAHSFNYDTAGRLTSDGVNTYTWDRANRLLSMGGSAYLYNGAGQRVQQTVSAQVTQYLLDVQPGLEKVLQATNGVNTTSYVHGPLGIHAQQNPDASWQWLLQDALGSVRTVLNSTATQQETRVYSPYGELTQTSGSNQSAFGFTGEPTDVNGLVSLRARFYNPTIGQFVNLDPLETPNRYAYVQDNPVNWTDPSGLIGENPGRWDTCSLQNSCPSNPAADYSLFPRWGAKLTVESNLPQQVMIQGQAVEPVCWKQEHKDYLEAAFSVIEQRLTAKANSSFNQVFGGIEFRYVAPSVALAGLTPVQYHGDLVEFSTNLISGPNGTAISRSAKGFGVNDVGGHYGFSITPGTHCDIGSTKYCNGIEHTIVHELGHAFDYRTGRSMFLYADSDHSFLPEIATNSPFASFCEHCSPNDLTETVADHFLNWVYDSYINVDLNQFESIKHKGANAKRIAAYWLGHKSFEEPPLHHPATPGIEGWARLASFF